MADPSWSARHITDSAQRILKQVPSRASDRGLFVVDGSSVVMMTLWSLLLWERKVGRAALEWMGVDPFDLARGLGPLLEEKARQHPVAFDSQLGAPVFAKTGEPYRGWDFAATLEPLLQQAEHEALGLGHNWVGSEHLLLAIIRLADQELAGLLQKHSVTHERVREAVLQLLHS
jgi:ATP-dependent Clp protease ATP-binding subunit ClpA